MKKTREITKGYLQLFQAGNPADNLLAVDHPEKGYLVLRIADKVTGDG